MSNIDTYDLNQIVEPILVWFSDHARILPWRENPNPYYVWISEIMLQQTRVEAVKPYFDRFITALPNVESLAVVPDDKLMKLWEGLGYYNRARNLKVAASQIMNEFGGVIPSDYEDLITLKGIGSYTAGAISSIAYGRPVPAVDGNVLRVISRVTGDDSDIMKQSVRNNYEQRLKEVLLHFTSSEKTKQQESNGLSLPGAFNSALMELGALVCVPNGEPHCMECPWKELCVARKEELIGKIPVKTKAKARKIEKRTVFILRSGDQVGIRKRPKTGLLAGLYELPNELGHFSEEEALEYVRAQGFTPIRIKKLRMAKHIFSHVEWHMTGYAILLDDLATDGLAVREDNEWAERIHLVDAKTAEAEYAIPSAFVKYTEYLDIQIGNTAIIK